MSTAPLLVDVPIYLIMFGIPVLTLVYPKLSRRSVGLRIFVTVIAIWFLLVVHRELTLPAVMSDAAARGSDYDGIAGSIGLLLFGWIFGLIGCLPALLLCALKGGGFQAGTNKDNQLPNKNRQPTEDPRP